MKINSFYESVYRLTKRVPKGRVTTYKAIANALCCQAYRLVGQALKNNPYAPHVPCHRVVKSDGTIGGFGGTLKGKAIKRKIAMLKKEGIRFNGKKIKNFETVLYKLSN